MCARSNKHSASKRDVVLLLTAQRLSCFNREVMHDGIKMEAVYKCDFRVGDRDFLKVHSNILSMLVMYIAS